METPEYILAILPPGLAIALEALTPFTATYFGGQATQIIASQIGEPKPGESANDVKQALSTVHTILKTSMASAASIAGLAPTIVSFVMAAITVFFFIQRPYGWLTGLAIVAILTVLTVIRVIAGKTLFVLEAEKIRVFGWPLVKPTTLFSLLIYGTNTLVIVGFTSVYLGWLS